LIFMPVRERLSEATGKPDVSAIHNGSSTRHVA
jgi:hypothetical protein